MGKAMQQVGCKWGLRLKALSFRKWTQSIRTLLTAQRVVSLEAQLADRGYKALVLGILLWSRWAANTALHHWHLVVAQAKERKKAVGTEGAKISAITKELRAKFDATLQDFSSRHFVM